MFRFKQFTVQQDRCAMKVGTDSILLGAWAGGIPATRALDIGTGTGLLALMLAQRFPDLQIDAVELDAQAARQANENVAASPWLDRIHVFAEAIQAFRLSDNRRYELIVCNPPFWQTGTGAVAPDPVRQRSRHTDTLSHEELLATVTRLLAENGRFSLILPAVSSPGFYKLAQAHDLYCTQLTQVQPVPPKPPHRWLMEWAWQKRPCQQNSLIIERGPRHVYSEAFIALTNAFYISF